MRAERDSPGKLSKSYGIGNRAAPKDLDHEVAIDALDPDMFEMCNLRGHYIVSRHGYPIPR